jgi:hypothetical protein
VVGALGGGSRRIQRTHPADTSSEQPGRSANAHRSISHQWEHQQELSSSAAQQVPAGTHLHCLPRRKAGGRGGGLEGLQRGAHSREHPAAVLCRAGRRAGRPGQDAGKWSGQAAVVGGSGGQPRQPHLLALQQCATAAPDGRLANCQSVCRGGTTPGQPGMKAHLWCEGRAPTRECCSLRQARKTHVVWGGLQHYSGSRQSLAPHVYPRSKLAAGNDRRCSIDKVRTHLLPLLGNRSIQSTENPPQARLGPAPPAAASSSTGSRGGGGVRGRRGQKGPLQQPVSQPAHPPFICR